MARIGKWKQVKIGYASPGGTPFFACGACGGSEHLHGAEYPKKKVLCDNCGRLNIYPWEKLLLLQDILVAQKPSATCVLK